MAWLVGKPGICTPIVGATAPAHISDAIASLDVELSENDVSLLERAYLPPTPERLRLTGAYLTTFPAVASEPPSS